MLLIWTLIAGVVGGFCGHNTRPALDGVFESDGMQRIAAYSVGSILLLAFLVPAFQHLSEIKNPMKRLIISHLLASASVGSGVMSAYMLEALRDRAASISEM